MLLKEILIAKDIEEIPDLSDILDQIKEGILELEPPRPLINRQKHKIQRKRTKIKSKRTKIKSKRTKIKRK